MKILLPVTPPSAEPAHALAWPRAWPPKIDDPERTSPYGWRCSRRRPTRPPAIDLADLTRQIQSRMPSAHEQASAQTAVRSIVAWILGCSEAFADSILDKMQVRGLVRFDGKHCVFNPAATESPGGVAMSDNEAKCLK